MRKTPLFLIVTAAFALLPGAVSAETIELVTYYPAPVPGGSDFDRLHASRATIGDDPYSLTDPDPLPDGTLLVADRLGVGLGLNLPAGPLHVVGRDDVPESVVFMPGADNAGVAGAPDIRVGIGTNAPARRLHVHHPANQGSIAISGASDAGQTYSAIYLADATVNQANEWAIAFKNAAATLQQDSLHFVYTDAGGTAGIPMAIRPNGNVGIGTASPGNKLMVTGPWTAGVGGSQVRIHSSGAAYPASISGLGLTSQAGAGEWIMHRYGADGGGGTANRFAIGVNGVQDWLTIAPITGYVGLGSNVNPQYQLDVFGGLRMAFAVMDISNTPLIRMKDMTPGAPVNQRAFQWQVVSDRWHFGSALDDWNWSGAGGVGSNHFVINHGGNIGMGTGFPTFRLHVMGSAGKPGGGNWSSASDARLKKNIRPLTGALERIASLRGVSFDWIRPEAHRGEPGAGFLGQELERVFPEWVEEMEVGEQEKKLVGGGKAKALSLPTAFNAYLVESIKELKERNERLEQRCEELERKLQELGATSSRRP